MITIVGLSLVPVAINNAAGGGGAAKNPQYGDPKYLAMAFLVTLIIIFVNKYFRGYLRALSVLLGIIVGTVVAFLMGMVSFEEVATAKWFSFISPFYFGTPVFNLEAIVSMSLVSLVCLVESVGVFIGLAKICNKELSTKDICYGIRGEGLAQMLGGAFNSFPYTTFSQNVGLVALSKVKSRYVCAASGMILICLGLIPKIAALITIIPLAVIGGAMIPMFGMVAASGIKMLASFVDFSKTSNLLVISCSLAIGLGSSLSHEAFVKLPNILQLFLGHGIVSGSITAVLLNLLLNSDTVSDSDTADTDTNTIAVWTQNGDERLSSL
ncbi:MAG: purine/pyrimidine permease [Oligoflexia bacterium]|nr:purine/pyrimidine permease [Oligoflexia bacterium]